LLHSIHHIASANRLLLFFVHLFSIFHANAQDNLNVPSTIDSTSEIIKKELKIVDTFLIEKKENKADKIKKAFKFISYVNYSDRGYGKDFTGIEKYEAFQGKKISCVDIILFKPFACTQDTCPSKLTKGQKFGNKIHFNAKEWFIKGDIFFKEGDIVNATLFADTERQLWKRNKFKQVDILILPDSANTDQVEVLIFLQDRLSWSAALGYINNRFTFTASTFNLFGLPNTLTLFAGINSNKHNIWAAGGEYNYDNIQASQINFKTSFLIEKLNHNVTVSLNRNFFNIRTKYAFNVQYDYKDQTISLNGNIRDPSSYVKAKSNNYSLWLAGAVPLKKFIPKNDDKLKFIGAIKLNYLDYKTRPFIIDRNYNELFIQQQNYKFGIGLARWDYYLEKNAFYIDIAEYFPKGISTSFWTGLQIDEIYGKRAIIDVTINQGNYFKKFGYLYAQANFNGYIRNKKGEQLQTRFDLNYVSKNIHFAKHMYFRQLLKGSTTLGFFTPEERYFNINDMNGIRGFYSPTLKGSKSITLSAECDFYLDKHVAMSKGMIYLFADVGWLSENGKKLIIQSTFQYGIGAGLRLRSVDLGLPYMDFQFSVYPKGKYYGAALFQFKLYEQNMNEILHNNMFYETPNSMYKQR